MRISLKCTLFLLLVFIQPVRMKVSALPEEMEGSGYDMEGSGSGSGDWSGEGEIKTTEDKPKSKDIGIIEEKAEGSLEDLEETDIESEVIVLGNSKSFIENKEVLAAVVVGGVTGVVIAVTLAVILFYKMQKKDDKGYILGRQRPSDEYH